MMKVICPRCGKVGYLKRMKVGKRYYWVVNHVNTTHYLGNYRVIEVVPYSKRFVTIAPYFGGKRFLVPILLKLIPPHEVYVEVFGGMAALLLNKSPSKVEVYNDINGDLVRLFKTIRDKWKGVYEKYKWLLPSRQLLREWRKKWLEGWRPEDDCEFAAVMIYLMRMTYGGVIGSGGPVGVNVARDDRLLVSSFTKTYNWLRKLHHRLARVFIENLDYKEVIRKYDSEATFFFLDPPYLKMTSRKQVSYTSDSNWGREKYKELKEVLDNVKGYWMMTHEENDFVEELFSSYHIKKFKVIRSTKTTKGKPRERYVEMVITNYRC